MLLQRASTRLPLRVGRVLGRGGEGAVYALENAPNLVAKIYLRAPTPAKSEKLRSMVRRATAQLLRVAAWPMDLLLDEKGAPVGFLMRRVGGREDIHELYNPKSRRQKFPTADFRFVVRVATNLSRAFAQVHALGNVIGDVNHGNALVARDGTVVLIDCDSIQTREGARIHTCDVGVPLFTPPELQGRPFRSLRRSSVHDDFGLAVLIFHLLFLGRHPFAGRSDDGDVPIERAIAESRFAYGARSGEIGMTAPPGTLPLQTFGARIAALFERAFDNPGATRPTAVEWVAALQELESHLVACSTSTLHFHPREQPCCWCEIEGPSGLRFFGSDVPDPDAQADRNLDRLWDAIRAIPAPEDTPVMAMSRAMSATFSTSKVMANRHEKPKQRRVGIAWILGSLAALVPIAFPVEYWWAAVLPAGAAIGTGLSGRRAARASRNVLEVEDKLFEAEGRWMSLLQVWHRSCSDERFTKTFHQLEKARIQLLELSGERQRRLCELGERRRATQRERYLDLYRIDAANLPDIGPEQVAALAEHGLNTAADLIRDASKLMSKRKLRTILKPGSGMTLRTWAYTHADVFERVPPGPLDAAEIKRIDVSIETQRDRLLATLRLGPSMLKSKREEILAARAKWAPLLEAAKEELDQLRGQQP